VFARHARHAEATRTPSRLGLEILCSDPKAYSGSLTAIVMPEGHDADAFRKVALENFNLSLGQGLTRSPARCSASAISATSTT
jgi:alanine-glyoxylate transaminase/serine-glyoxylate transaminase/serine-pyruvate transaminase